MIEMDTPLTKLKKEYEGQIKERDEEISLLKNKIASVHGINELLKFELVGLETKITDLVKSLSEISEHVKVLKINLPDMSNDK